LRLLPVVRGLLHIYRNTIFYRYTYITHLGQVLNEAFIEVLGEAFIEVFGEAFIEVLGEAFIEVFDEAFIEVLIISQRGTAPAAMIIMLKMRNETCLPWIAPINVRSPINIRKPQTTYAQYFQVNLTLFPFSLPDILSIPYNLQALGRRFKSTRYRHRS
jgi:hypothetical protein